MHVTAANLFQTLSHETRLRCVVLLWQHGELCVCELTHALDASQPHVSHHLAHLRDAGVIVDRRQGLWVHYRLNPALPDWVWRMLSACVKGIAGEAPFASDGKTLAAMPNRPGTSRCA